MSVVLRVGVSAGVSVVVSIGVSVAVSIGVSVVVSAGVSAGEQALEVVGSHATILLSARLGETIRTLRRDLQNNAAQAALTLREWDVS